MLKFQLFNSSLPSLTIETDPDGSNDFELRLKRNSKSDGVFLEFNLDLSFVKEARNYVLNVIRREGIDGIVGISIYTYDPNQYEWILEYKGQLKLPSYKIEEATIDVAVEEVGFKRKFLNLEEVDVDLGATESRKGIPLTNDPFITLPLAPKTILKKAVLEGSELPSFIESGINTNFADVIRIGGDNNASDFQGTFIGRDSWINATSGETPVDTKNYILKVREAGLYNFDFSDFVFDLKIEVGLLFFGPPNSNLTTWEVDLKYRIINDSTGFDSGEQSLYNKSFSPQDSGATLLPGDFDFVDTRVDGDWAAGVVAQFEKYNETTDVPSFQGNLVPGDEVYVWFESGIDFVGPGDSEANVGYRIQTDSKFVFDAPTVFPQTNTRSVLVYEFLEKICQVLTDQVDCFRSEYFGRTDSTVAYPEDGEGALLAITNGRSIRQLENQTIFANWKEAYQSIEAVYCVGWGFETLTDGTTVIRVEPKNYFYDKGLPVLTFDQVSKLSIEIKRDLFYQNILVGYAKVENINQVNGIDEFNSERKFSSPVDQAKGELDIRSKYRASGFEIESQRRLVNSTEESKLDDENYFIVVKRDGSGGFEVEQGIDFESVTNVFDPDTAYNLRISPARNLRRWAKIIASNVIEKDEPIFQFTFGNFNYLVQSKLPGEALIREDGNYDLTGVEPLFRNEIIKFEAKLPREQRNIIRGNVNRTIQLFDWEGNSLEGFLDDISMGFESNKGNFNILRTFRF